MPERWNKAAALRREQIESGLDITFNKVFVPYFLKLVGTFEPKSILEVGCGTGHLAAKLATRVSYFEALEPSLGMHNVSLDVLSQSKVQLHKKSVEDFRTERKFDMVISHLCSHVVADIDAFFRACSSLVSANGLFVFSLPHPCFWNNYKEYFPKEEYRYATEQFTSAQLKITKDPNRPIEGVPFHHRPLGRYVSALHKAKMALSHLEEIVPSKTVQNLYGEEWRFPRYCVFHALRIYQYENYCKSR